MKMAAYLWHSRIQKAFSLRLSFVTKRDHRQLNTQFYVTLPVSLETLNTEPAAQ